VDGREVKYYYFLTSAALALEMNQSNGLTESKGLSEWTLFFPIALNSFATSTDIRFRISNWSL